MTVILAAIAIIGTGIVIAAVLIRCHQCSGYHADDSECEHRKPTPKVPSITNPTLCGKINK